MKTSASTEQAQACPNHHTASQEAADNVEYSHGSVAPKQELEGLVAEGGEGGEAATETHHKKQTG